MKEEPTVLLVNKNRSKVFEIENYLVDRCLPVIGPGPFSLYCLLMRLTSRYSQKPITPSYWEGLPERFSISPSSFQKHLSRLQAFHLIDVLDDGTEYPPKILLLSPERNFQAPSEKSHTNGKPGTKRMGTHSPTKSKSIRAKSESATNVTDRQQNGNSKIHQGTLYNKDTFTDNSIKRKKRSHIKKRKRTRRSQPSSPENNPYTRFANRLRTIIKDSGRVSGKINIRGWHLVFRYLHMNKEIPLARIATVLDWYETNIGGPFVPQAFSANSFCDKFLRLEAAMDRGKSKNRTTNGSRSFSNGKKGESKYHRNAQVIE